MILPGLQFPAVHVYSPCTLDISVAYRVGPGYLSGRQRAMAAVDSALHAVLFSPVGLML